MVGAFLSKFNTIVVVLTIIAILSLRAHSCYGFLSTDIPTINNITADEISVDTKTQKIFARNNIIIESNDYKISTDNMLYDRQNTYIVCKGKTIIQNKKESAIQYTEYIKIDLLSKEITMDDVELHIKNELDQAIIINAASLQHQDQSYKLSDVSLTTCTCDGGATVPKDNDTPPCIPLWQINAGHINIDTAADQIKYKNVKLALLGHNILYIPYFTTPALQHKYKSGFLIPGLYGDNNKSTIFIPYYLNISPYSDITFNNYISLSDYPRFETEIRKMFHNGAIKINLGGTKYSDSKTIAGYTKLQGNWQNNILDRYNSEFGVNSNIMLDKYNSYYRIYHPEQDDILISRLYAHLSKDDSYYYIGTDGIQDTRQTNKITTTLPKIILQKQLPLSHLGKLPSGSTARFYWNGSLVHNMPYKLQSDGIIEAYVPIRTLSGQQIDIQAITRSIISPGQENTGIANYSLLTTSLKWPFILHNTQQQQYQIASSPTILLEPIANLTISGKDNQYDNIPSSTLVPKAYSLANPTISPLSNGLYGAVLQYGFRTSITHHHNNAHSVFDIIFKKNQIIKKYLDTYPSEYDNTYSLYLSGQHKNINIENNTWFNQTSAQITRNELNLNLRTNKLAIHLIHLFINNQDINTENDLRHDIAFKASINPLGNLWINYAIHKQITEQGRSSKVSNEIGLNYRHNCITADIAIQKSYRKIAGYDAPLTNYTVKLSIPF